MKPNFPNFIYIGTGKAGSTWLFKALQWHPEVFVTPVKETNFFDLNFDRGLGWYEQFFAGVEASAVGEISHRYIQRADVARRIHESLGQIKLLVVFRKPEEFVLSCYLFACRNGRFTGSIEDWMACRFEPASVRYRTLLAPFLEAMGRNNVYVGCFDDLAEDPDRFLAEICDFLGVSRLKLPETLKASVNAAARPRSSFVACNVNRVSKFLKRRGGQRLIAWVKRRDFVQSALYKPIRHERRPAPPLSVSDAIRAIAEPEIQRLDKDLNTHLWQRWYDPAATNAS